LRTDRQLHIARVDRRLQALIGNCRIRLPVPANIALQTAGAIGGVPGSPAFAA